MSELAIIMAVYGQPNMLRKQLGALASYSADLRSKLKVIVVDDCGDPPAEPYFNTQLDLEIYRITEDIPWNQMGARNLGMRQAPPTWCLMIDPDMIFPEVKLERMLAVSRKLRRGEVLRYGLRHVNEPDRPVDWTSPNTYLIHKEDFERCGGYDEDYRGNKGWSDVQLLDTLRDHYRLVKDASLWADFYSTSQVDDAAVMSLDRRTAENKKLRIAKAKEAQRCRGWKQWVIKRKGNNLRFGWTRVWPACRPN